MFAIRALGKMVFFFTICGLVSVCFGQPSITRAPSEGPPTTTIMVSGQGFAPSTYLTIYLGRKAEITLITDITGSFQQATLKVGNDVLPGLKLITAVQSSTHEKAQAPFMVRTSWTQYNFNSNHTGFNPYENVINRHKVEHLGLHWSFTTGSFLMASPSVVKGIAYVGSSDHNLYALDAVSGAKLWSFGADGEVDSTPAVANGVVYVGSLDFNVYALNAATGTKLWSYQTGLYVESSPTVADGVVYVGSADKSLYAIDAQSGAKLWSFATGGVVLSIPAVANGVVYVGSDDNTFYAINATTGTKSWSFSTGGHPVDSSPAVLNGVVYFSSEDTLYALNATTGVKLWSYAMGGGAGSPAIAYGSVYVSSNDGNLYALDAGTGTKRWSFPAGNLNSVAIANGLVYLCAGNVFALNASTGTQMWESTENFGQETSPVIANGVVYLGSINGNLYAYSLGTF
jgi:outer membrane protein assembly factor BamB